MSGHDHSPNDAEDDIWTKSCFFAEIAVGVVTYAAGTAAMVDGVFGLEASSALFNLYSWYGAGAGLAVAAIAAAGAAYSHKNINNHAQDKTTNPKKSPTETSPLLDTQSTPTHSQDSLAEAAIQIDPSGSEAELTDNEGAMNLHYPKKPEKKIDTETSHSEFQLTYLQVTALIGDAGSHIMDNALVPIILFQNITKGGSAFWVKALVVGLSSIFGTLTAPAYIRTCIRSAREYSEDKKKQASSIEIAGSHKALDKLVILTAAIEAGSGFANYFYASAQALDMLTGWEAQAIGLSYYSMILGAVLGTYLTTGATYAHAVLNVTKNVPDSSAPLKNAQRAALVGDFISHTLDNSGTPALIIQIATNFKPSRTVNIAGNLAALFGGALGAIGSVRTCEKEYRKQNESEAFAQGLFA